jgi:hypothetical protein
MICHISLNTWRNYTALPGLRLCLWTRPAQTYTILYEKLGHISNKTALWNPHTPVNPAVYGFSLFMQAQTLCLNKNWFQVIQTTSLIVLSPSKRSWIMDILRTHLYCSGTRSNIGHSKPCWNRLNKKNVGKTYDKRTTSKRPHVKTF